jgi:hypothetical protein
MPGAVAGDGMPPPRHIAAAGKQPQRQGSDALGNQALLRGPVHPDRDIGLAEQQIVAAVRGADLQRQFGQGCAGRGQGRRQHQAGHDPACRDPHAARKRFVPAPQRAAQSARRPRPCCGPRAAGHCRHRSAHSRGHGGGTAGRQRPPRPRATGATGSAGSGPAGAPPPPAIRFPASARNTRIRAQSAGGDTFIPACPLSFSVGCHAHIVTRYPCARQWRKR